MSKSIFISELQKLFTNEEDWSIIINALHQNPLVWNTLNDKGFLNTATDNLSNSIYTWTPAALSLLLLENSPQINKLTKSPIEPLPELISTTAAQEFRKWKKSNRGEPPTLRQVGLIALHFREQRVITGNWSGLIHELNRGSDTSRQIAACLYGMVPDEDDLLIELNQPWGYEQFPCISLHTLVSNPHSNSTLVRHIRVLISGSSPVLRISFINQLNNLRPDIAQILATDYLEELDRSEIYPLNLYNRSLSQLQSQISRVELTTITKNLDEQKNNLIQADEVSRRFQAYNSARIALSINCLEIVAPEDSIASEKDYKNVEKSIHNLKQAIQLDPSEPYYVAALSITLLQTKNLKLAETSIIKANQPDGNPYNSLPSSESSTGSQANNRLISHKHPAIATAHALLAFRSNNLNQAQEYANSAFSLYSETTWPIGPDEPIDIFPLLCDLLIRLQLYPAAIQGVKKILDVKPSNPEHLYSLAKLYISIDQPVDAITPLSLLLSQEDKNKDARKLLIYSLESSNQWTASFREREKYLNRDGNPSIEEKLNLVYSALCAHFPGEAKKICEQLVDNHLDINKEPIPSGITYWLLGESEIALGKPEVGLQSITKSIDLNPNLTQPWISLINYYTDNDNVDKSEETLNRAVQTLPNSPEIQLELGKFFLAQGLPSKSLPYLQYASELVAATEKQINLERLSDVSTPAWQRKNITIEVQHYKGKVLRLLGHNEKADQAFRAAYEENPTYVPDDSSLTYDYAQSLVSMGYLEKALPILKAVIRNQPENLPARVDLAKLIIQLNNDPTDQKYAITLLNDFLYDTSLNGSTTPREDIEHHHNRTIEAKTLLAEALVNIGEQKNAKTIYRSTLDSNLPLTTEWRSRLSLGLGNIYIKDGELETAIAALQDGIKADPKNQKLLRKLSETYLAHGLVDSAYQTAYTVYKLNPSDVDSLSWYADQCLNINEISGGSHPHAKTMSIQALNRAASISPSRSDLLLRAGIAQLTSEQPEAAKELLLKVAASADTNWEYLTEAAHYLRDLGEPDQAIKLYKRSLRILNDERKRGKNAKLFRKASSREDCELNLLEIYKELIQTHRGNAAVEAALSVTEQGMKALPDSTELQIEKADILAEMGRLEQAIEILDELIFQKPELADVHLKLAKLNFSSGKFAKAITDADRAIELSASLHDEISLTNARLLAAEISVVMLQFHRAMNYINGFVPDHAPLQFSQLLVELALELGDLETAEVVNSEFNQSNMNDVRSLACKTRIKARSGGIDEVITSDFRKQYLDFSKRSEPYSIFDYASTIDTSMEIGDWNQALDLINPLLDKFQNMPLAHFKYAQTLLRCSEAKRIADIANIATHAPAINPISENIQNSFNINIELLMEQLHEYKKSIAKGEINDSHRLNSPSQSEHYLDSIRVIEELKTRGNAFFDPSSINIDALRTYIISGTDNPELIGGWIFAQNDSLSQEHIEKIIHTDPAHSIIWIYLSIVQSYKLPEQAVNYLKKALLHTESQPFLWICSKPVVLGLLANFSTSAEKFKQAGEYIDQALNLWSDEPSWHMLAADISINDPGEFSNEAVPHLMEAIKLSPEESNNYLRLGELLIRQDNPSQALEILNQGSRHTPNQPKIWLAISSAYQTMGDLDNAAKSVEHGLAQINKGDNYTLAEALVIQGEITLRMGKTEEALNRGKMALHLNPENPATFQLLSKSYEDLGQPTKAIAALERAISLTESPFDMELDYVRFTKKHSGIESAIRKSVDLMEKYPREPKLMAFSADILQDAGHNEEALLAAREALKFNTDNLNEDELANIHTLIGKQLNLQGQLDQAVYHLSEAVKFNSTLVDAFLELGQVYIKRREFEQAIATFEHAIENCPDDPRPYFSAGVAYKENKDYISAEKLLHRAVELAPNDLNIHRMHGSIVVLNLVHNSNNINADIN